MEAIATSPSLRFLRIGRLVGHCSQRLSFACNSSPWQCRQPLRNQRISVTPGARLSDAIMCVRLRSWRPECHIYTVRLGRTVPGRLMLCTITTSRFPRRAAAAPQPHRTAKGLTARRAHLGGDTRGARSTFEVVQMSHGVRVYRGLSPRGSRTETFTYDSNRS